MKGFDLVCASANPHKVAEINEILAGLDIALAPRPVGLADVEEDGDTLEANARLKARAVTAATGKAALADDTGLFVDALDGAPGVRTARYAGEPPDAEANIVKLLAELAARGASAPSTRRARFVSVALVNWPNGEELVVRGVVEGTIVTDPRGAAGFGYDPIFEPDEGGGLTFAELDSPAKHAISHRGRALRALAEQLLTNP